MAIVATLISYLLMRIALEPVQSLERCEKLKR